MGFGFKLFFVVFLDNGVRDHYIVPIRRAVCGIR